MGTDTRLAEELRDLGIDPGRVGYGVVEGGLFNGWPAELIGPHRTDASKFTNTDVSGIGPLVWRRQDKRIREEILERFIAHDDLDTSNVEVQVKKGIVRLLGGAHDETQRHRIVDLASSIRGVREVRDDLTLRAHGEESPTEEEIDDEVSREPMETHASE